MRNLQENFRELTYPELLKMNGGYGGSSGGGSRGYSGTSGGGNPCSSRTNASAIPVGRTSFVRRDEDTLTTSRKNSDGSETVTTVNKKTGAVISSYTTGIRKSGGSKTNSTTGDGSYSTSSSGWNGGGYSGSSSGSGSGRSSGHGYSGTSSGASSGTNTGNSQPKNTTTEATTPGNNSSGFKHQVCADPKQVHCDIIAWNHAVDAGLNPAGKGNDSWDGNKLTVDAIFNNYYADEAVEFNADLAGKKGYIFYDWTGDGTFDHVEYCEIESGGNYNYFSNEGFEQGESLIPQNFARDKNAGALNGGPGKLKFVSLN